MKADQTNHSRKKPARKAHTDYTMLVEPVTLMIPAELLPAFRTYRLQFGSAAEMFVHLLRRYRFFLQEKAYALNGPSNARYQRTGRKLERVNLRVSNMAWFALNQAADFTGLSASHLFSLLFEWEATGMDPLGVRKIA